MADTPQIVVRAIRFMNRFDRLADLIDQSEGREVYGPRYMGFVNRWFDRYCEAVDAVHAHRIAVYTKARERAKR